MKAGAGRILVVVGSLLAAVVCRGAEEEGAEFFEKQVRPILVARCYECHSGQSEKLKGGLRLDSREAAIKGGDSGPAVVPGKLKESLLVDAINYGEVYQMPPKSKLPAEEIAVLTKWVEWGAPWGREAGSQGPGARSQESGFDLAKRKAEHWCWQPIGRLTPPRIQNAEFRIQNGIDAFVVAKLEAKGLAPAPLAEARTLLRRVHFDLIGLPPKVEEVEEFVRAFSPSLRPSVTPSDEQGGETERGSDGVKDAYAEVVDRLLASPRFGERWGRHWLDLVRYAESRGHEFDYDIPNAFEYRDYVIRALNADVPYDQFVIEHVAGDLLTQPRLNPKDGFNESIIGSGFWFLGEWCHSPVDIRQDECDRVDNMLDVFSKTFLGVTVACARCHDHKFDAISQADYYALAGYLQSSSYRLARFETWEEDQLIAEELRKLAEAYRRRISAAVATAIGPQVEALAKKLVREAEGLRSELGVAESDLRGAEVIVDYAEPVAGAWMTNGPTFGSGPVRAGQLILTGDAAAPLEVAAYGSARREAAWTDLGLAKGSANDPGRLGGWLRAGRTLKTPTFTLKSGSVHYLIEGVGQVYAAVDSHAMINGPLHGELQKETGGNSDLPVRWITHDLSRYVGHRVHLEFSPKEEEDFRVLMVVQGERPAAPAARPNRLIAKLMAKSEGGAGGGIEAAGSELIAETLELLAAERVVYDLHARDRAALANWLIAEGVGDATRFMDIATLAQAYAAKREKIIGRIRRDSRLCLAMWDGTPVDENLLIRGNHKTAGPVVPRRGVEAVEGVKSSGFGHPEGTRGSAGGKESGVGGRESGRSGRLELAQRLTDESNPLVSRVIVNRVWQHLLGRGIVPSVDNFGVLGEAPTHPELLDYLAREFMEDGWSIKRLVRRIVMTSTYKQGSGFGVQGSAGRELGTGDRGQETGDRNQEPEQVDPRNLLFHRQNMKRLEGEALRDAILAVSSSLDETMYGPSVPVHLTAFMQGRGRPKESGPVDGQGRRSIYTAVRRNFLSPMMLAFDTPIPFTTIGRRNVSNVPAQALILMNDPLVIEQSRKWAKNVAASREASSESRIRRMYLAAFSREPSSEEVSAALLFLEAQASEYGLSPSPGRDDERVWADLAHVLFNTKEFLFVK